MAHLSAAVNPVILLYQMEKGYAPFSNAPGVLDSLMEADSQQRNVLGGEVIVSRNLRSNFSRRRTHLTALWQVRQTRTEQMQPINL